MRDLGSSIRFMIRLEAAQARASALGFDWERITQRAMLSALHTTERLEDALDRVITEEMLEAPRKWPPDAARAGITRE